MGFLPENASFEELVADCFAAYRGSGMMLSPLDAEVVVEWSTSGVPFEVVARGIRKAAEKAVWDARPGEPALRSIRACRKEVDAEIKKYQRLAAGRTRPFPLSGVEGQRGHEELVEVETSSKAEKKYAASLRKIGKAHPMLFALCERLAEESLSENPPSPTVREQRLSAQLLRALPFSRRLALLKEARELGQGVVALSVNARKLSRRFHRGAVLRRALDLPSFW